MDELHNNEEKEFDELLNMMNFQNTKFIIHFFHSSYV